MDSPATPPGPPLPPPEGAAGPPVPPRRPRERVLWNTVAVLVGNALASVSQALAMLLMARHLSGKEWGVFGYLMSWIEVFRVIANFGLDQVALRLTAIGQHAPRAVLRHLLALNTSMLGVVMVAVAVASLFIEAFGTHRTVLVLLAGSLLPVVFTQSLTVRFQAEHAMDRLIPVRAITGLLYVAGVWVAASAGLRLEGFVTVYLAFQVSLMLAVAAADRWTWRGSADDPLIGPLARPMLWSVLRHGIPAGLEALVVVLYQRLGVMFLEHYQDMETVGHYFIALKVSEPLLMIAGALAVSAFPVLSRLAADGNIVELKRRFALYSVRSLGPSCLFALLLTLFGHHLLVWIKPAYGPATGALIALGWAAAVIFQNAITVTLVKAFGKFHYVTFFATINLVVFLGLSLALVPRYGATGAGLSTLGTESVNCLFHFAAVFYLIRRRSRDGV